MLKSPLTWKNMVFQLDPGSSSSAFGLLKGLDIINI